MRRTGALLALALALAAGAGCRPSTVDPMKEQARYDPYEASEYYRDGLAMRHPPAGTVPRERTLSTGPLGSGGSADAGYVTANPVPLSREALDRGRHHFDITCGACHGLLGDGVSVPSQKMSLRPAPSLHTTPRPDGFVFEAISRGYGFMPAYAEDLTPELRWEVVAYLRALQRSQSAPLDAAPAEVRERLLKEGH